MNIIAAMTEELYRIFDLLNRSKFDSSLPKPVITVSTEADANVLGHFTLDPVWTESDADNEFYEININPSYFNDRSTEEIVGTLLHEMVHFANKLDGVKDCSGVKNKNHNKKFKYRAESVGLVCNAERDTVYGYGYTKCGIELIELIRSLICPKEEVFRYFRKIQFKTEKPKTERKKTQFPYVCPTCGQTVKAKRGVRVMCADCMEELVIQDDEESDSEISDE